MSFQARNAIIEDDEEWLNIPPVLRKLLRNLSEEGERNRALTEALRQEQRDTNILLRRLIQKQTDMELDFARNNLLLTTKAHLIRPINEDGADGDRSPDDSYTRKKLAKMSERVKVLEATVTETSSTLSARKAQDERLQGLEGRLEARISEEIAKRDKAADLSASGVAALEKELQDLRQTVSANYEYGNQQVAFVRQVTENVKAMDESCTGVRAFAQELDKKLALLTEDLARQHSVFDRRFVALQHAVEKIHGYLEKEKRHAAEARKTGLEEIRGEVKSLMETHRAEVQQLFLNARQQTADLMDQMQLQKRQFEERTQALAASQETMSQKLDQQVIADLVDMSRQNQRLAGRVGTLEDDVAGVRDGLSRLSGEEARRAAAEQRVGADASAALREEVRRVATSVADIEANTHRERDRLRGDVDAIRSVIHDGDVERQRLRMQVTRVCEVVHDLTNSLQAVEQRVQGLASAAQEDRRQRVQLAAAPTPPESLTDLPKSVEPLRRAIDEATKMLCGESESSREALRSLADRHEATALRVSQVERKLADVAVGLDCLKQTPAPTATLPVWAEQAIQELSPTLVTIDAMKRRIAALEARADEPRADRDRIEEAHRGELQLQVADAVEDTRRRLLELSRRVLAQEQLVATTVARRGFLGGAGDGDTEGAGSVHDSTRAMVGRLASDVTGVLEKLYVTEQSLSTFRVQAETDIAGLRERVTVLAAKASAEPPDVGELVEHTQGKLDPACAAGQSNLAARVTECEAAVRRVAGQVASPVSEEAVKVSVVASMEPKQAELQRQCDALAERTTTLAGELQTVRSITNTHAEALHTLSISTSAVESALRSLRAAEEQRATAAVTAAAAAFSPTELADVRALLSKHAELLQAQASTLRGVVDRTLPELRGEWEGRLQGLRTSLEAYAVEQDEKRGAQVRQDLDDLRRAAAAQADEAQRRTAELASAVRALEEARELSTAAAAAPPCSPAAAPADVLVKLQALDSALRAYAYPRAQLEERLENLWMSVVSLVARKEDTESVSRKLEELHRLVSEESAVRLRGLRDDVDAVLADKVGLRELQEIIESSALGGGVDDGEDDF